MKTLRRYVGPVAAALIAGIALTSSGGQLPRNIEELAIYLSVAIMGLLVWFIQRIVDQQTRITTVLDNHLSTLHEQQVAILGILTDVKAGIHEHDAWEREQISERLKVLESGRPSPYNYGSGGSGSTGSGPPPRGSGTA